ncbi:MAG: sigma-54-dependent transcriptional regulator [Parashewanella sp.]
MKHKVVLLVDDDADIRFALSLLLSQQGYQVIEAEYPETCLELLTEIKPDIVLLDLNFTQDTTSGKEGLALLKKLEPMGLRIILMSAWANIELAVAGLQLGALDFVEKPWNNKQLLEKVAKHIQLTGSKSTDRKLTEAWVAESEPMKKLEALIGQLAPTDASLLILGENGTGKSLLAKRIHQLSSRNHAALISLNMAAIAESLFESELFGHKRGAFTDAKQNRDGAFHRAESGTLFMDEVGTLPLTLQPKLLQVLETGEYTPLGANQSELANVRLIAATNQDLASSIEQGAFRQDLYYRLNTFIITLPPLRQRQADILPLANNFVAKFCKRYGKAELRLSESVQQKLLTHPWKGNVRELSHTIERAVLICSATEIDVEHLLLETRGDENSAIESGRNCVPELTLDQLERQRICDVLDENNMHVSQAAKVLGISRNALYRRMEKYQLVAVDE